MMADQTQRKRVVLTLEEKINAIKQLDRGIPAYRVAADLSVGKTQIQSLRKRKAELINDYENNAKPNCKRRRYLTGNEEINDLKLAWVKDAVGRRINLSGPLIQAKALEFASRIGNNDFKASKGWLESFKQRNNLVYGKMSGERGDVNIQTVQDWKNKLGDICSGYEPENILNMDETGLFYRDTTRHTFHFKSDDCAGGKRSKERITVLLCASASGEKFKPLVIGKSREPRCFKKIKSSDLPVHYYYNTKAWMNSSIYVDYLKKLNHRMRSQKRHVLLFVDNAPSHPEVNLSNIEVKFLPPNTTAYTQPMDQGIIQSTKLKFRKRQLQYMVREMERQSTLQGSQLLKQISILDAIYWLNSSWNEVEEGTIAKCFAKSGFISDTLAAPTVTDVDYEFDPEDDIPLAVLKVSREVFGCAFNELPSIDKDVATCNVDAIDWDQPVDRLKEILNPECVMEDECSEMDSCEKNCDENLPTFSDVCVMVEKLKDYAVSIGNTNLLQLLVDIDDDLSATAARKQKQTKISDFFQSRDEC